MRLNATESRESDMHDRYRVVNVLHSELMVLKFGQAPPSKPIEQHCFRVEDSLADGDYIGTPYATEAEAVAACDKLNKGQ